MMRVSNMFRYVLVILIVLQFASVTKGQDKLEVGNLKICKLQDAAIYLNISLLKGIERNEAIKLVGGADTVLTPVNAYLVQTKNHTVLVDAGMGKPAGEKSGNLIEQMKKAGVDPNKVDLILITHFHYDHIGGLLSPDGKRLFPNATIRVSQAENDFWMRDSNLIPVNLRSRAAQIRTLIEPYISAKAYSPFLPNEELGDGIKALSANGHTPGHTVYAFSSKGKQFWCVGDLIHVGAVQFKHPSVSLLFDSDSQMAIASRVDFFKRAAKDHIIIAGAHMPEMVRLKIKGEAFTAKPVKTH